MNEDPRKSIESMMAQIIDDIDRKYIRKMQVNMYKCASKCCDNSVKSIQEIQRCVDECTSPVENAQQLVQNEFERSKKRLDRCFEECGDKFKDKVGPNPTNEKMMKYRGELETCTTKCLENFLDVLSQLKKSIVNILDEKCK